METTLSPFENYKCHVFQELFELSLEDGFDSYEFAKSVMTDDCFESLFITDDCQEWCDGRFLYGYFKYYKQFKKSNRQLDRYVLQFAGYLYKYWMLIRGTDRKEVYKILPLERLVATFGFYHTQGWDYIIDDAIQIYKSGNFIV